MLGVRCGFSLLATWEDLKLFGGVLPENIRRFILQHLLGPEACLKSLVCTPTSLG